MLERRKLQTDLCVIGGGLAGMCAAIAAAREGLQVVLMQERPVLGGNTSSEIRMWICGARGFGNRETGIIEEILLENLRRNPTKNIYVWQMVLNEFVEREKNITLLLNCTCNDAEVETGEFEDGRTVRIKRISGYQMTTQRFIDVEAKLYADCSGDSILAPLTGAEFRIGRESAEEFGEDTSVTVADKMTMGNSCLLQGRETTGKIPFVTPPDAVQFEPEVIARRKPKMERNIENFWYLELGGDRDTIADAEEIAADLVPLAKGMWNYVKNSGEYEADNWDLEFFGFLPGKRESRRMMGEYIITERDIAGDTIFPDTVAFGGWGLDDHYPAGFYYAGHPNKDVKTPAPYCIPYRALYSKNVENLYFAGRNISMTHMAMSSVRVMATCALLGEAVGTAASVAVRHGATPHGVYKEHLEELQGILMKNDCFLPHFERERAPICMMTPVENGEDSLKDGQDRPNHIYGTETCGCKVKNGIPVAYRFWNAVQVHSVHIVFDSDLERETLPGDRCEQTHSIRCNIHLDSPMNFSLPATLCRSFRLDVVTEEGRRTVAEVKENVRRAYDFVIDESVIAIELTVLDNYGDTDKTGIFSFDFN